MHARACPVVMVHLSLRPLKAHAHLKQDTQTPLQSVQVSRIQPSLQTGLHCSSRLSQVGGRSACGPALLAAVVAGRHVAQHARQQVPLVVCIDLLDAPAA